MSSLGLSEELLSVRGYLADAKGLVEEQFGQTIGITKYNEFTQAVLQVAQMLQIERTHKKAHSESAPEKKKATTPRQANSDKLMSRVRSNPKLPPMISIEQPTEKTASVEISHSPKSSKVSGEKARNRKSEAKPRRVKDSAKRAKRRRS